ncbi:MAG: hypothetical protein JW807_17695 [Spirochaetes bacterium]|nr:hypothetical protein [Spirochaetota bacterium]
MKIIARFLLLTAVLTGLRCGQVPDIKQGIMPPVGAHCSIYDATHNDGNEHFYFLQPIVSTAPTYGTFDPGLKPMVEICIWNGSSCGASLAIFNEHTGEGSEAIRVDEASEHYIVNWHTGNILDAYSLNAGETFRIRVLVGDQLLGYADLAVANSAKELKNVDTDEFVPLLEGRTLPIKFRIEEGALISEEPNISAGNHHTCTLDESGHAWCWGRNTYGELGNGTSSDFQNTPTPVSGGHSFSAITTGYYHTCGITDTGDAYCWGYNNYGQAGNAAASEQELVPVLVSGGHKFQTVEADGYTTCGLTQSGEFYCWGINAWGQFGIGSCNYINSTPVPAATGIQVSSFGVAGINVCVLDGNNEAYCAGEGSFGGNGNGSFEDSSTMVPVSGGHIFRSLSSNYTSSCGIDMDNNAWCWGYNRQGQLGIGSLSNSEPYSISTPAAVVGGISFQRIARGILSTCGISTGGDAYCWGYNNNGQAGTGVAANPYYYVSPQLVIGGFNWLEIDVGYFHACGITNTGDVYCWGNNESGQLGTGDDIPSFQPIAVTGL